MEVLTFISIISQKGYLKEKNNNKLLITVLGIEDDYIDAQSTDVEYP